MSTATLAQPASTDRAVTIDIATERDRQSWDSFVATAPGASGYHRWGWRDVFSGVFGHESIYLCARDAGEIVGVLPLVHVSSWLFGRTLTSLPFVNYGGVVSADDATAEQLIARARDLAAERRCPHVELRHVDRRFPHLPARQHKVTMLLALQEGMWERLDRKVRNQVRKAQKSDLTVERGSSALVDDFYTVFARNMRDLGTPVYPKRLFAQVLRTFSDSTEIHVVRLKGQPIAAGLTYRSGTRIEVPWASSVRDFNSLCPNHLLYWNIVEQAAADGIATMDFGRSTPGEGTYRFKEQWGAQPVPLHWEYVLLGAAEVPNLSPSNPKYRLMVESWKKLPLPIATALGPRIVGALG